MRCSNYLSSILPYIHNRWIHPSHKVTIQPHEEFLYGHYHDCDTVMMHAMFQLLVDYVEIECAALGDHYENSYQRMMTRLHTLPGIHWFIPNTRNPLKGLHHLRWEMKLPDDCHKSQAAYAVDIFRLYRFWKHERPLRRDPWENYIRTRGARDWTRPLTQKERRALDHCQKIRDIYDQEDDRMLRLLLRRRRGMWT